MVPPSTEGKNSIALGHGPQATGDNQTVIGRINALDENKAFIIGNGTIDISGDPSVQENISWTRSNALTVDWDGNQTLAGKLTVGAQPTTNMDVTTKQYVDDIRDNNEGLVANTYSNSSTYAAGAYAIYEHILYVCTTPVTVAEDFDNTKWTAVKLADRVNVAEGNIATLKTEVETATTGLLDRATALETTVGDSTSGLVKDVADIKQILNSFTRHAYDNPTITISGTDTLITLTDYASGDFTDIYLDRLHYTEGLDYTISQINDEWVATFANYPTGISSVQVVITSL